MATEEVAALKDAPEVGHIQHVCLWDLEKNSFNQNLQFKQLPDLEVQKNHPSHNKRQYVR